MKSKPSKIRTPTNGLPKVSPIRALKPHLRNMIVVDQDCMILTGRARLEACEELTKLLAEHLGHTAAPAGGKRRRERRKPSDRNG
jgi:hypothetical protein